MSGIAMSVSPCSDRMGWLIALLTIALSAMFISSAKVEDKSFDSYPFELICNQTDNVLFQSSKTGEWRYGTRICRPTHCGYLMPYKYPSNNTLRVTNWSKDMGEVWTLFRCINTDGVPINEWNVTAPYQCPALPPSTANNSTSDASKGNASKGDTSKGDASKGDTSQVDASKVEATEVDTSKKWLIAGVVIFAVLSAVELVIIIVQRYKLKLKNIPPAPSNAEVAFYPERNRNGAAPSTESNGRDQPQNALLAQDP